MHKFPLSGVSAVFSGKQVHVYVFSCVFPVYATSAAFREEINYSLHMLS